MLCMSDIQLLPSYGARGRSLAFVLLTLAPLAFGVLALALGQDANWDLRNYHWYNAYALLNGRMDFDLLPSQTPWFYNPALDVPFYLLATHAPAMAAGFALGFVQGLNFILLFMLAHTSLIIPNPRQKVVVCALLAVLGMLGGGGIALIGTTFYDNVTSLGLFASALLIIRNRDRLMAAAPRHAFTLALLIGIPSGLMMGLKLPSAIFCVGLCFGIFSIGGPFRRLFLLSFAFGIGVLIGLAIALGPWAWVLQTHFGNPLFPYFNDIFHSPLAPYVSARDTQFVPHGWRDKLLFPFLFAKDPYLVGEIDWRDWRMPLLYALLPLAVVARLLFGRNRRAQDALAKTYAARYLLTVAAISYFAWLSMFAIYRYAVPLEMLTPLLIVMAVGLLPFKLTTRELIAAFLLIAVAVSIEPGNWTRRPAWLDHFVEVKIPPLPDRADTMILMAGFEPYSHVLTAFPPDIPFVRIQSNFASPEEDKGINILIRERVEAHKGPFMLLMPAWQLSLGEEALAAFHLALARGTCQTVIDRLYDDKELALCKVVPVAQKVP